MFQEGSEPTSVINGKGSPGSLTNLSPENRPDANPWGMTPSETKSASNDPTQPAGETPLEPQEPQPYVDPDADAKIEAFRNRIKEKKDREANLAERNQARDVVIGEYIEAKKDKLPLVKKKLYPQTDSDQSPNGEIKVDPRTVTPLDGEDPFDALARAEQEASEKNKEIQKANQEAAFKQEQLILIMDLIGFSPQDLEQLKLDLENASLPLPENLPEKAKKPEIPKKDSLESDTDFNARMEAYTNQLRQYNNFENLQKRVLLKNKVEALLKKSPDYLKRVAAVGLEKRKKRLDALALALGAEVQQETDTDFTAPTDTDDAQTVERRAYLERNKNVRRLLSRGMDLVDLHEIENNILADEKSLEQAVLEKKKKDNPTDPNPKVSDLEKAEIAEALKQRAEKRLLDHAKEELKKLGADARAVEQLFDVASPSNADTDVLVEALARLDEIKKVVFVGEHSKTAMMKALGLTAAESSEIDISKIEDPRTFKQYMLDSFKNLAIVGLHQSSMERFIDLLLGLDPQGMIGTSSENGGFFEGISGTEVSESDFKSVLNGENGTIGPQKFAEVILSTDVMSELQNIGMPIDLNLFKQPLIDARNSTDQNSALANLKLALHYLVFQMYNTDVGKTVAQIFCKKVAAGVFGQGKVIAGTPGTQIFQILEKHKTTTFSGRNHTTLWADDFPTQETKST